MHDMNDQNKPPQAPDLSEALPEDLDAVLRRLLPWGEDPEEELIQRLIEAQEREGVYGGGLGGSREGTKKNKPLIPFAARYVLSMAAIVLIGFTWYATMGPRATWAPALVMDGQLRGANRELPPETTAAWTDLLGRIQKGLEPEFDLARLPRRSRMGLRLVALADGGALFQIIREQGGRTTSDDSLAVDDPLRAEAELLAFARDKLTEILSAQP